MQQDDYEQLLARYKAKIKEEFGEKSTAPSKITSREYTQFKEELYPARYSWYEKACVFSNTLLKLKPDPAKAIKVQKNLDLCHLDTTPGGVTAFALLAALFVIVVGSLSTFALPVLFGLEPMFFFVFFFLIAGVVMVFALQKI